MVHFLFYAKALPGSTTDITHYYTPNVGVIITRVILAGTANAEDTDKSRSEI